MINKYKKIALLTLYINLTTLLTFSANPMEIIVKQARKIENADIPNAFKITRDELQNVLEKVFQFHVLHNKLQALRNDKIYLSQDMRHLITKLINKNPAIAHYMFDLPIFGNDGTIRPNMKFFYEVLNQMHAMFIVGVLSETNKKKKRYTSNIQIRFDSYGKINYASFPDVLTQYFILHIIDIYKHHQELFKKDRDIKNHKHTHANNQWLNKKTGMSAILGLSIGIVSTWLVVSLRRDPKI